MGEIMASWLRAGMLLLVVLPWVRPAFGQDSSECASLSKYAPPGSLVVTRGEIIGQPSEHATMTSQVPLPASDGGSVGYLVTGDQVEFVAACQGFSYVRYHGKSRTTTGWIESGRLLLRGKPFVPLPANVSQLCAAAERAINDEALNAVPAADIPSGANLNGKNDPLSPTPLKYIPLNVEGRKLAVVQMADGGTCSSVEAQIRTGDLKHVLSPDDAVSRDPFQLIFGGNGWAMGLDEDVVSVEGKPLLRSSGTGNDFALSSIDKTGDTQFICRGRLVPLLSGKPVVVEGDPALCESIASSAVPIAMHSPEGHFTLPAKNTPEVELQAVQWGMADINNTGHEQPVGVINYNYSSGAGCGEEFNVHFPLPLDGAAVSWPQALAAFHALYGNEEDISRPSDRLLVRIVRHDNQIYVELLDASLLADGDLDRAPVQSVWRFSSAAPKKVCAYRTSHNEVKPASVDENGRIR
jgi:hypothetical protein